jgi:hypothetical protein
MIGQPRPLIRRRQVVDRWKEYEHRKEHEDTSAHAAVVKAPHAAPAELACLPRSPCNSAMRVSHVASTNQGRLFFIKPICTAMES